MDEDVNANDLDVTAIQSDIEESMDTTENVSNGDNSSTDYSTDTSDISSISDTSTLADVGNDEYLIMQPFDGSFVNPNVSLNASDQHSISEYVPHKLHFPPTPKISIFSKKSYKTKVLTISLKKSWEIFLLKI